MKHRIALLALALVLPLALAACTQKTNQSVGDSNFSDDTGTDMATTSLPSTSDSAAPSVVAAGEVALTNGTVTIDKVISNGSGWLDIHIDNKGIPGDVIGHTAVHDGENDNVVVTIDAKKATPKLYAMLHVDTGTTNTYDYPTADMPAMHDDGTIISSAFMLKASVTTPATKTFTVKGSNFAFDLKEIKVNKGDTVVINFVNGGGMHDWVIDQFNAKTPRINGGETAQVKFVADKAGTFEYYCSVGQHRAMGMKGNLIVQ